MSLQSLFRSPLFSIASISIAVFSSGPAAHGQTQTRDGAVVGGVAGAVIGGIIGHQNKGTPEGALIGGAVGAVAGGLIGNQQEKAARQRYYQQQQWQQAQRYRHATVHAVPVYGAPVYTTPVYAGPVYATPVYSSTPVYTSPAYVPVQQTLPVQTTVPVQVSAPTRVMTVQEVITLTRNGISETVIANQIQSTGLAAPITTEDVLALHGAGVSDFLITELQNAPIAGSVTSNSSPVYTSQGYSVPRQSYRLQPIPSNRKNF